MAVRGTQVLSAKVDKVIDLMIRSSWKLQAFMCMAAFGL